VGLTNPVDEYLATLPEVPRAALEDLRRTIKRAAPEAVETIAYDMPAFRSNGRFLVSYAAYKKHCSLFPASRAVVDALGAEIAPYVSGKATIRFDPRRPLAADVVERIVQVRLAETAARGSGSKSEE
jgi:uncharacterized protein YdhG (YjbR/CyaY superfamily)